MDLLYTPTPNNVWVGGGYIGIILSVCPSVCNCIRSILFLWRSIGSSYFTQRLLMTLTKGHLCKFKVIFLNNA